MKDFEPRKLLPAALALVLTSCQSEPDPPALTFTKTEETQVLEPTKTPPTQVIVPKPFIPRGFDRLLTGGSMDEL